MFIVIDVYTQHLKLSPTLGNKCHVMSLNGQQCLLLTLEAENARCLFPSFLIGMLCHNMGKTNEKYLPWGPKDIYIAESPLIVA